MSTPLDIINLAYQDLGDFVPGETLPTTEQTYAFQVLQMMWANWGVTRENCFTEAHSSFLLTPTQSMYTVGPSGTWNINPRPEKITSWTASAAGLIRTGGMALPFDEFNAQAIERIGSTSAIPVLLAADTASPNINVQVHPLPNNSLGAVQLTYWLPLTAFTDINQILSLPPGYEAALHFNLAVALYPQYEKAGGMSQALAANAASTLGAIQKLNSPAQPAQPQAQ